MPRISKRKATSIQNLRGGREKGLEAIRLNRLKGMGSSDLLSVPQLFSNVDSERKSGNGTFSRVKDS